MTLRISATLVRCDIATSPGHCRWDVTNIPPAAVYYVAAPDHRAFSVYYLAWPIHPDEARLATYIIPPRSDILRFDPPVAAPPVATPPLFHPLPTGITGALATPNALVFELGTRYMIFPRFVTPHSGGSTECGGYASRNGINLDSYYQHLSVASYVPPDGCPAWPGVRPGRYVAELAHTPSPPP